MGTVHPFGKSPRLLDPDNAKLEGQSRVNAEIFTAMEILGRKLERVEKERDFLAERVNLLESGASIDGKTGKLYLPVVVEGPAAETREDRRWMLAATLLSSLVALAALTLTLMRPAPTPVLTAEQTAALQALTAPPAVSFPAVETEAPAPPTSGTAADAPPVDGAAVEEKMETAPAMTAAKTTETAPALTADAGLGPAWAQVEQRAAAGVAAAQNDLGNAYLAGKDVPQSDARALHWLQRAAENGVAAAYYKLGLMHQRGIGVPRNSDQAMTAYEHAAEMGHTEAMYALGLMYVQTKTRAGDAERGIALLTRAAKAGMTPAAYMLGVLYEGAFLGPRDADKALTWYRQAAAGGDAEAQAAVTRLTEGPVPRPAGAEEALHRSGQGE